MPGRRERNSFRQEIRIAEKVAEQKEEDFWEKTREFYKGNHEIEADADEDIQVVNLIFSNIVSQLPTLTHRSPEWNVVPGPMGLFQHKERPEAIERRADALTAVMNKHRDEDQFQRHFQLGVLDSLLSFGVYKTFHRTIKGRNPSAGEPKVDETGSIVRGPNNEPLLEPERIAVETEFKTRRVRPENFLVDPRAGNYLNSAGWVAEKVFMDVKTARDKFNEDRIQAVRTVNADIKGDPLQFRSPFRGINSTDEDNPEDLGLAVIYEVWDLNENRKFYLVQDQPEFAFKEDDIPNDYQAFPNGTPYTVLKYHEVPDEFYPIPPTFPQLSINFSYDKARQDINDYRDMLKLKFLVEQGRLESDEAAKLQSSRLAELIEIDGNPNTNPPIAQVPTPKSPPAQILDSIQLDKQDLQQVSGITDLQRGGQTRSAEKATQSLLANQNAESKLQWKMMKITRAAKRVGQRLLTLIQNRSVTGGTVKSTRQKGPDFLTFTPDQIKGVDLDLEVEFGSSRPRDPQSEKQELMQFLNLLGRFPQLLRHFDTQRIAEKLEKNFDSLRGTIRRDGVDQTAFQQAGGSGLPEEQGPEGGAETPGPSGGQRGLERVLANIEGGAS